MLESAYQKGQENKEQIKQDFDAGVSRAKDEAKAKKEELEQDTAARNVTPRPQPRPARRSS